MLSKEDNQVVTNTDPQTPMGELFRRFWLPVALAEELAERDGPPVHVRVLGEDLVAFRDSDGRVGLLDAYCPHRGAPLFFGRNEDCGLRCVYHGWMFDVDGACVDLPNAPEGETFRHKIKLTSYPCLEAGDLIWAYLGPPAQQPPFPEFEWLHLPSSHRYVKKFRLECNYLQAMEGDYDPSHARFLHSTLSDATIPNPLNQNGTLGRNPAVAPGELSANERFPRIVGDRRVTRPLNAKLEDTDSGVIAVSANDLPDGRVSASVAVTWMMPIFCTAGIAGPNTYSSNMRIPIDNKSLMFYRLRWSYSPIPEAELEEYRSGGYYYPELIPGTWTPKDNINNNYNIDRMAQKQRTYSGIRTFPLQDIAMMENQWGPIADRTKEHLTSSDEQIIHVRRRLLRAAKMLDDGIEPSEPWHPQAYRYHRETAIGDTREEAIARAKARAMASLLPESRREAEPAAAPAD
ncbi:MAG TPA: Rieske 2Fe-2S domain-containing protein [Dehalococcoidia bacterium]|nr:Rieske 2Fe-2S domain-containing protein [Dehalococcoidia bacterium]